MTGRFQGIDQWLKTVDKTVGTNSDIGRMIRHVESMTSPIDDLLTSQASILSLAAAHSAPFADTMQPFYQAISPTLLAEVHAATQSTSLVSSMFNQGMPMEWFQQNQALYRHAEAIAAIIAPIPEVPLAQALSNLGLLHHQGIVWPPLEDIEEELEGITELDEEEVNGFISRLAQAQPLERLAETYNRLPASVKVVLFLIMGAVLKALIFDDAWDYISPALDVCLAIREDVTKSAKDKVRSIKRHAIPIPSLLASDLRFITTDGVPLFEMMSSRSERLRELNTGAVVVLLDKHRNWAYVKVMLENGETDEGWVYSRYLERFKVDSSEDF